VFITECKNVSVKDMMPSLYNYVTIDPDVFLSHPSHMEMMFNMCRTVSACENLSVSYLSQYCMLRHFISQCAGPVCVYNLCFNSLLLVYAPCGPQGYRYGTG